MVKRAHTSIPVHEFIAERWSPRSFDETAELEREHLVALLEAARWAPSAMNAQPWRFAAALRGSAAFEAQCSSLNPSNAAWAHRASALVVAATKTTLDDGRTNAWAAYDLGLAVSLLTVQAHVMDLHVHQMGGFNKESLAEALHLPSDVVPMAVLAIGRVGAAEQLEGPLYEREVSRRQRKPLEEIVLSGLE